MLILLDCSLKVEFSMCCVKKGYLKIINSHYGTYMKHNKIAVWGLQGKFQLWGLTTGIILLAAIFFIFKPLLAPVILLSLVFVLPFTWFVSLWPKHARWLGEIKLMANRVVRFCLKYKLNYAYNRLGLETKNTYPASEIGYDWQGTRSFKYLMSTIPVWHQNLLINMPDRQGVVDRDYNIFKFSAGLAYISKCNKANYFASLSWFHSRKVRKKVLFRMSVYEICTMVFPINNYRYERIGLMGYLCYYLTSEDRFFSLIECKRLIEENSWLLNQKIDFWTFKAHARDEEISIYAPIAVIVWERYLLSVTNDVNKDVRELFSYSNPQQNASARRVSSENSTVMPDTTQALLPQREELYLKAKANLFTPVVLYETDKLQCEKTPIKKQDRQVNALMKVVSDYGWLSESLVYEKCREQEPELFTVGKRRFQQIRSMVRSKLEEDGFFN